MATLLDLVLLLVISKEALQYMQYPSTMPQSLLWGFVVALPFFLGMGNALRKERRRYVRSYDYVRVFIGQGIAVGSTVLFLGLLSYSGVAPLFWGLFLFTILPYLMGRVLGMTLRGILGLLVIGIVAWMFLSLSG